MLYLAAQFAWFLLAAFVIGLVMGWIGHDGRQAAPWGRALAWLATLFGLGAGLTLMQTVNGAAARWIETALLFVAAYVGGCALAGVMRASARPQTAGQAAAPAMAATAERRVADVDAAQPLAKVEGEDDIPGQRPHGLVAAKADMPDDLKIIKGVGPQNEERLHRLGIWHFAQIAAWTPQNCEWVGSYLAFPGRIEREDWVGQAKALAGKALAGRALAAGPERTQG